MDPSALATSSTEGGRMRANASLFQAQAKAAESFGRMAASLGGKLKQEEDRRERNDARLWLYENASKFEVASKEHSTKLEIEQDPDDYATDADIQNNGQQTFRNKRVNWFDTHQNSKNEKDGRLVYNPPNDTARQMWSEFLAKKRGAIETEAIQFESELRVQARYNQAERILDTWVAEVANDHTKLQQKLNALNQFVDEHEMDNDEAKKLGFNQTYLDPSTLAKIGYEKKQDMLQAHLDARLRLNPYDVYLHIEGKGSKYKKGGTEAGDFGTKYGLDPTLIDTYRGKALQALTAAYRDDTANVETAAKDYLVNLEEGGNGGKNKQMFADGASRTTYSMGYGGALGDEKIPLFGKQVEQDRQAAFKHFQERERIAKMTAGLVTAFESKMALGDVQQVLIELEDSVKDPKKAADLSKGLKITQDGKIAKLSSYEMQAALQKASARITAVIKMRSEDPVMHAIKTDEGGYANLHYKEDVDVKEKIEALDTHYHKVNQPKHNRPVLTLSEAENKVDSINRVSSGDDLISQMKIMREQYGEYYPRVWQQLTTMENGLDANYAFLEAIPSSMLTTQFAEAILMDEDTVKNFYSDTNTTVSYSKVAAQTLDSIRPYLEAFTGGLPHRENEVAVLKKTLIKMAGIHGKGSDRSLNTGPNHVMNLLKNTVTLMNEENLNFYLTPDMQTEEGTPLNPRYIEENASNFFKDIPGYLNANPLIHIPGGSHVATEKFEEMSRETFIEHLESNGKLVMNDTGDGLMLVMPLTSDGVTMVPVKEKKVTLDKNGKPTEYLANLKFKFDDFMDPVPTFFEKVSVQTNEYLDSIKKIFK